MSLSNLWRLWVRGVAFLAVTCFQVLACFLEQARKGAAPQITSRHAQKWGERLTSVSGLRLHVIGEPPPEGVLLVANHRSYLDGVTLLSQMPITFLARADVAKWPLLGWAASSVNSIYVDRSDKASRLASREKVAAVLREGGSVLIFSEGTTSFGPGILPYHFGGFQMAADGGFPVVPIAFEYMNPRDCWVGDEPFVRHFLDRLAHGDPEAVIVFGPTLRSTDAATLHQQAQEWTAATLAEIHAGKYGPKPMPRALPVAVDEALPAASVS